MTIITILDNRIDAFEQPYQAQPKLCDIQGDKVININIKPQRLQTLRFDWFGPLPFSSNTSVVCCIICIWRLLSLYLIFLNKSCNKCVVSLLHQTRWLNTWTNNHADNVTRAIYRYYKCTLHYNTWWYIGMPFINFASHPNTELLQSFSLVSSWFQ